MARAATTSDTYNAIAEPKRRQLLEVMAGQHLAVNDIVARLGWSQPLVSKHLRVLREVGLVDARHQNRQKIYSLNAQALKPVHEWVGSFERFWSDHLHNIKTNAEHRAAARAEKTPTPNPPTN